MEFDFLSKPFPIEYSKTTSVCTSTCLFLCRPLSFKEINVAPLLEQKMNLVNVNSSAHLHTLDSHAIREGLLIGLRDLFDDSHQRSRLIQLEVLVVVTRLAFPSAVLSHGFLECRLEKQFFGLTYQQKGTVNMILGSDYLCYYM